MTIGPLVKIAIYFNFSGPIASALSARFSCRSVVMFGGVLAMTSLILSGYAMNVEFLYFSYGVLGGIKILKCKESRRQN